MKSNLGKVLLVVLAFGSFSPLALADDAAAAKSIAAILVGMNHFPSDEGKATLHAITQDDSVSADLKAVALAVHNVQHAATADDKAALAKIVSSSMASTEAKALAEIVVGFNHMPSADAKASLQAML